MNRKAGHVVLVLRNGNSVALEIIKLEFIHGQATTKLWQLYEMSSQGIVFSF